MLSFFGQIVILIFLFHCWWKVAIFSSSGSKNQELNNILSMISEKKKDFWWNYYYIFRFGYLRIRTEHFGAISSCTCQLTYTLDWLLKVNLTCRLVGMSIHRWRQNAINYSNLCRSRSVYLPRYCKVQKI